MVESRLLSDCAGCGVGAGAGHGRRCPIMKPFVTLAKARTPEGAELTLHARDTHFFLYVNRQPLMGTNASVSEMELARLACARLTAVRAPRVLIGGLGFGFTLRQVLELTGPAARVEVAELLPEVVAWNREFLHEVNGRLLDNPRVRIHTGDVFQLIETSPAGHYDAILLDVDNGPIAMVQHGTRSRIRCLDWDGRLSRRLPSLIYWRARKFQFTGSSRNRRFGT